MAAALMKMSCCGASSRTAFCISSALSMLMVRQLGGNRATGPVMRVVSAPRFWAASARA